MRSTSLALSLVLLLSLAACGGTSTVAPAGATASDTVHAAGTHPCSGYGSQTVGAYDVLVAVEAHAPVLTAADAATSTDADTHIIVAGTGAENAASANKHVEVHVCAHDGAPAQHLTPTATLQDLTTGGAPAPVALLEVYAKGDDPANVHYGNNVAFSDGHQAQVVVAVGGASATFKIAVE